MLVSGGKRWMVGLGALVVSLGLLFGDVRAQEADGDAVPAVDVTIDTTQNLTGAQQIAWIEEQMPVVKGIYRQVQGMLDRARKEKETLKITCLDDKLTQIHTNLRGIEERKAALEVAVNGGDKASADQQFTILKIYVARVQGLKAEAESCIGDSDVVIGESETIVEVDEDVTMEDPSQGDPDVQVDVGQTPHASGFF